MRNQVLALEEELKRERERVDIKLANKKLLRLQKDLQDKDKHITALNKAIEELRVTMLKYTSERVTLEEKNTVFERKESFVLKQAEEEKKTFQTKIKLLETSKEKVVADNTQLKVEVNRRDEEIKALKAEKDTAV